jgi:hypothetical protein
LCYVISNGRIGPTLTVFSCRDVRRLGEADRITESGTPLILVGGATLVFEFVVIL